MIYCRWEGFNKSRHSSLCMMNLKKSFSQSDEIHAGNKLFLICRWQSRFSAEQSGRWRIVSVRHVVSIREQRCKHGKLWLAAVKPHSNRSRFRSQWASRIHDETTGNDCERRSRLHMQEWPWSMDTEDTERYGERKACHSLKKPKLKSVLSILDLYLNLKLHFDYFFLLN